MRRVARYDLLGLLPKNIFAKEFEVSGGFLSTVQQRSQHTQSTQAHNIQGFEVTLPGIHHPQSLTPFQPQPTPPTGPLQDYQIARDNGFYRDDDQQQKAAELLQNLYDDLTIHQKVQPKNSNIHIQQQQQQQQISGQQQQQSWWNRFGGLLNGNDLQQELQSEMSDGPIVKGVYMYGGVGTGKTMLMDMFARGLVASGKQRVQRMHFHDFMIGVHQKLRNYQGQKDPLCMVAEEILSECNVMCLDEFFVTDVADAMILNRLFTKLWFGGLILVATSNRHPDSLYEGGLQRELFVPFILQLKDHCVVHDMASQIDHRRLAQQQRGSFFTGPNSESELLQRFSLITNNQPTTQQSIKVVMGRQLKIPKAAEKCCHFKFSELCEQPLSAADYIGLSENFHTVAVSNVPIFTPKTRSAAYRFVALIDVLYERKIRLLCSAEGSHEQLLQHIMTSNEYNNINNTNNNNDKNNNSNDKNDKITDINDKNGDLLVDNNLGFAKHRTVSRLGEMQSMEYAVEHAEKHEPALLLALKEAQQKMQSNQNF